jgi:hypothetical protein
MFRVPPTSIDVADLERLGGALAGWATGSDSSVLLDEIAALERLRSAIAAAQARRTAAFIAAREAEQRADGMPERQVGQGVTAELALARHVSPHSAGRYCGFARVLTADLPHTFAALQAGRVSEWRAVIVANQAGWLSAERRRKVDAELAPKLERLGDRGVEAEAKKIAYRLDPDAFVERRRVAESERHVAIRPLPDAMVRLSAVLPLAPGVACYAALRQAADMHRSSGDPRSGGQVMADTLIQRLTGAADAGAVAVEIQLVMTDQALLSGDSEPAHVSGYGPVPASLARELALGRTAPRWIRRLYTKPKSGQLVAMESRRRLFTAGQRRFIEARDQHCRTPWCEAPIRHIDHVLSHARGGKTELDSGNGRCEACNYTKETPGWRTRAPDGTGEEIVIQTPTGHRYRSRAPDLPGAA